MHQLDPNAPRPLPIRAARAGRCALWAMEHGPTEHKKKHAILVLIGAYLDNGISDPSIRELASRAGIEARYVVAIVNWLEVYGFIRVDRGRKTHQRNRYSLAYEKGGS
jgi:DNA-binding MarR family transcriptional regulator